MTISFKILLLSNHHNRGQAIVVRQLEHTGRLTIDEGSLLNGISIFHSDAESPETDIYILRPTELEGYPEGFFYEGQTVQLELR